MNILIVCTEGQNRSKYLAKYLQSKGHNTDYGGVKPDGANPLLQEKVDWADIIVTVREHIKYKFLDRFEPKDKKIIHLEVIDNPKRFSKEAQELAEKSWIDFQEKYVYSELRKQIEKYLSIMDYKKITIKSYNQNTKELSEKFKGLMDLKRRYEFQRFINLIKGEKILDLGCGSGDHSQYFKEKGLDVTAVDLSEEMIKLCKEKGLKAFIKDIEQLDFEEKTFDGIWAVTSLLHIPKIKIKKVIEKLNNILKDEGILYVCVKEGEGERLIEDESGNTSRFFAFWKEDELIKMFEKQFYLIENKKVQQNNTTFLQAFFKKRTK
jgi:ubiquinone/menaquinone biosynthesis C-methylase UbiE/galactitol-specific phosphotransferase system IIB component